MVTGDIACTPHLRPVVVLAGSLDVEGLRSEPAHQLPGSCSEHHSAFRPHQLQTHSEHRGVGKCPRGADGGVTHTSYCSHKESQTRQI